MNLASYLGLSLKSDAVIELLEQFDMEVVYDFDRLHENTPDRYYSSAKGGGFELGFNEQQVLESAWCYVKPRNDFAPVDVAFVGVPCYESFQEAKTAAEKLGSKISVPTSGSNWIRIEQDDAWHHYEFSAGGLALVTLMLPWK